MMLTAKMCTRCKEDKELTEFHKRGDTPSGYASHCKPCRNGHNRTYSKTGDVRRRARVSHKKWYHSEHGQEYVKECAKTDNYKARTAVSNAVRLGNLTKSPCAKCGEVKVEAHHWSYEKKHWLDVMWLCVPCHAKEHLGEN